MQGQGVCVTIAADGNSVTVDDAATEDNKACGDIWGKLFGSMASIDQDSFEHTERMHVNDELPPIEDTVDLEGNG